MPKKSAAGTSTWVDPDDAPEITDDFLARAEIRDGEKLVRRGRPKVDAPKKLVSVRLDQDVLSALRAAGPGWQTKMNDTLRRALHLKKAG